MRIQGKSSYTIWRKEGSKHALQIIDQRWLPHRFVVEDVYTLDDMVAAISEMHLRGAIIIGVAGGFGMHLAALEALNSPDFATTLAIKANKLKSARPTAVNLAWAVETQLAAMANGATPQEKVSIAASLADRIWNDEIERSKSIGLHGLSIFKELLEKKTRGPLNVLTHCNAGALACVDYGTATAPIYRAFDEGLDIHVWVDETRPRSQGAKLTAWELLEHGVSHTLIVDNSAGYIMRKNLVDIVIVGADRITRSGDVANKIGTYQVALAAKDNKVPFYVAFPSSTIDWNISDGLNEIPVETRSQTEVTHVEGLIGNAEGSVLIAPSRTKALNYAFDITPARLVTGFITEKGICDASENGLTSLFPETDE